MFGEKSRGVGEGEVKNGKKRNKLDKRLGSQPPGVVTTDYSS